MSGLDDLKVLLVDDYEHMGQIIRPVLNSAGFRGAIFVNTGAEALQVIRKTPVDLAIIDFNLGDMDGVELTRTIRQSPHSPNPYLPIIMLTAHSELRRIIEARDAGVNDFCRKPVTAADLLNRIGALISQTRPFVRAPAYFGPDRRRRRQSDHEGPERREGRAPGYDGPERRGPRPGPAVATS